MKKFFWRRAAVAAVAVPMLALTACSSQGGRTPEADSGGGGQAASTPRMKIALITHAPAGDTFWDTVRKGAEEAAA